MRTVQIAQSAPTTGSTELETTGTMPMLAGEHYLEQLPPFDKIDAVMESVLLED